MSMIATRMQQRTHDHFEPEAALDPQAQRQLRAHLEQIDFSTFAANKEILAKTVGQIDTATFQRLAVAAAQARAQWVADGIALAKAGVALDQNQVVQLAARRRAFEEFSEVYDGLRRMVERGYVRYQPKA